MTTKTKRKQTVPTNRARFGCGLLAFLVTYGVYFFRNTEEFSTFVSTKSELTVWLAAAFILIFAAAGGAYTMWSRPRSLKKAFLAGLGAPAVLFAIDIRLVPPPNFPESDDATALISTGGGQVTQALQMALGPGTMVSNVQKERVIREAKRLQAQIKRALRTEYSQQLEQGSLDITSLQETLSKAIGVMSHQSGKIGDLVDAAELMKLMAENAAMVMPYTTPEGVKTTADKHPLYDTAIEFGEGTLKKLSEIGESLNEAAEEHQLR